MKLVKFYLRPTDVQNSAQLNEVNKVLSQAIVVQMYLKDDKSYGQDKIVVIWAIIEE